MICKHCAGTGKVTTGKEMVKLRGSLQQKDVALKMKIASTYLSDLENDRRTWNAVLEGKYRKAVAELTK